MKRSILTLAVLATVVACHENKVSIEPSLDRQVSIVASTTKTTLSENTVVWSDNDAIAVCFKGDAVAPHRAVFSTTSGGGKSASFTSTLPNYVSVDEGYNTDAYAVYPAAKMADDGTVTFSLPAAQVAEENGSFASGLNLSSAVVSLADLDEDGSAGAIFLNAFSIIRFSLSEGMESVEITADKPLTGDAPMVFTTEGTDKGRLTVGTPTTSSNTVSLTPAVGVTSFDAAKNYNVLVYPGTYATLNVKVTDTDGIVYDRSLGTGSYEFKASNYYTFNFDTDYVRTYTFTGTGRTFAENDKVAAVFMNGGAVLQEEELTAAADLSFTGKLLKSVVAVESTATGFAVYPSTAYAMESDKISYNLPADGTQNISELWSASLTPSTTEAAFSSVVSALGKVKFTVPSGITIVKIECDQNFVGTAEMTVDADGKLVAGAGDANVITINPASPQSYELYIYPVTEAKFTVTLTNGTGAAVDKVFAVQTVGAGEEKEFELSDIEFGKDGTFENEDFVAGEGTFEF
ncbi:MAG: hypothetical protein IJ940_08910 [Bacteroidales bacterium]|nr:hypothetical protein [Bacteroidales bacterium]